MTIGEKLLKLRKETGYSQEEVAEKLKVTRQTISKWETDQSFPDFDKIVPLCELYDISTEELFSGERKEKNVNIIEEVEDPNIRKRTALVLSVSIFMYFIAVIWIIMGAEFLRLNEVLVVSVFLLICAIATVIIIYHFVSLPKKKSKEEQEKEKLEANPSYKAITGITSLIFTIVYLTISFVTMAWHITWIIWLVYAIAIEIIKLIFALGGDNNAK